MTWQTEQAAFGQLLLSGTLVHEATFEVLQGRFGIQVNPNLVIIVSIDRYPVMALGKPIEWKIDIGQKLVKAINKAIQEPYLWVWMEEGILAVLLELPINNSEHSYSNRRPQSVVRKIQDLVDEEQFSVSCGMGSRYDNPYFIYRSYEEAKESMVDRFFQGNRMIYQYVKEKRLVEELEKPITLDEKMELLARVRIGDEEGSVNYLKILLERAAHSYKFHVDMFKSEAIDLIMSLSRMALEMGGDASAILSENARVVQVLIETVRYDNFVNKLCDYWRKVAKQAGQLNEIEASPLIRSAIKYMKEKHNQKLTLKNIAEYCHVNAYYFAHVFKRETGMSSIDFLNQVRIEKAVFLLKTTEMPIQQIAGQVGFVDANYFSRKFKLIMNCTPTDYREARLC